MRSFLPYGPQSPGHPENKKHKHEEKEKQLAKTFNERPPYPKKGIPSRIVL